MMVESDNHDPGLAQRRAAVRMQRALELQARERAVTGGIKQIGHLLLQNDVIDGWTFKRCRCGFTLALTPTGKVYWLRAVMPAIEIASTAGLLRSLTTTCRFHPRPPAKRRPGYSSTTELAATAVGDAAAKAVHNTRATPATLVYGSSQARWFRQSEHPGRFWPVGVRRPNQANRGREATPPVRDTDMSEISNRPPREQRGRITNPPSKGVLFSRNPEGSQPDYRGGININGIESLATIVKLAKALDVDLVDFFRKP